MIRALALVLACALAAIALARFSDEVDLSSAGGACLLVLLAALGITGVYGWLMSTG